MYGKIFDTIFGSSIMEEDIETRYIWMCMLTIADKEGFVDESIPALARRFNVPQDAMSSTIDKLLAPDPSSRTPEQDGRRIEPIRETYGWKIINYEKYRGIRDEDERRDYMREYMRKYRKKKEDVNPVNLCKPQLAYSDSDSDTDKRSSTPPDIEDQITTLCDEIALKIDKRIFNPYSFNNKNKRKRPEARYQTLIRCKEEIDKNNNGFKKDPWPYLEHILKVEHQNTNERDVINDHEIRKKEELAWNPKKPF